MRAFSFPVLLCGALFLAPGALSELSAQNRLERAESGQVFVTGRVLDQVTDEALASAQVFFRGESEAPVAWEGVTDDSGRFRIGGYPPGAYTLRIEIPGFSTFTHRVEMDEAGSTDLTIELAPAIYELEPVVATATRQSRLVAQGFYDRLARGFGTQFTREEIERRAPLRVSDLLTALPGIQVTRSTHAGGSTQVVFRGGCVPQVVLNGTPFAYPVSVDDLLSTRDLEALEVYRGVGSPPEFTSPSACGSILAWSRQPPSGEGGPFPWRKVFGGVGFMTLVALLVR